MSGYLLDFNLVDDVSAFFSRKCVDVMSFLVSGLLMMPVFTFLESDWL